MANIGFRVYENVNRPEKELIEGFKGIQTANIGDCMNRMGAINGSIRQMNEKNILGPAYTVKVPSGDNLMIFLAVEKAQPGDVLVIDGEGCMDRALVGEILAKFAESKKLGGFLVDGCIRDSEILTEMDLPIFAKGTNPNGPYRNGPGEINVPVSIGGKVIHPGDIIIGDGDGVIVVKQEEAKELQRKAHEIEQKEVAIFENIANGKGLDLTWMYEKLKQEKCEFIK
ncbi:RraA family protein [Bacillus sp. RG28]|uniref:Putative 4-hydroxy-4-methyl-2-oxoglutarate aldolase n=1 Tax=Gottfriedia endophytica TaxID=2820819 RepID=A0A940NK58_9BACI|nr:RraA family protein [Gottfriedia endophytica]MBP0725682.1 RraA family protein [Gottfriedia endophytica]